MPAVKRKQSVGSDVGGREGDHIAPFASTSIVSLTPEERAQWNGFCEIESEPVGLPFFYGVTSSSAHDSQFITQ